MPSGGCWKMPRGRVYLHICLAASESQVDIMDRETSLLNSMQTHNSVTFYFMKKIHFVILAGSVFCQKMIRVDNKFA